MVALLIMVLVGFCGLVLDFGTIYANRRAMQNAADAAALAGARAMEAQFFGGTDDPVADALTWARKNGVTSGPDRCRSDGRATVTYNQPNSTRPNSWEVRTSRLVPLTFAPVLGISSQCVTASATAVVTSGMAAKVFPFSLFADTAISPFASPGTTQSCDPNATTMNQYCFVLKEGASGSASGNFGILDFLCTGNQNKSSNYIYWTENGYGSRPGETIPGPIPDNRWTVCTFTGNTASANSQIDNWILATLSNPPPSCPKARIDPDYKVPDFNCPLIGLLPILEETSLGTGSSGTVTIVNFAVFEIVGLTDDHATGHKSIVGQFLQWAKTTGPTQPQDPSGKLTGAITIRLVE